MNVKKCCKSIYWKIIKSVAFTDKIDNLQFERRQTRTLNNDNQSAKIGSKRTNEQMLIGFPGEVSLVFNHGKNRFSESGQPPPSEKFITTKIESDKTINIAFLKYKTLKYKLL